MQETTEALTAEYTPDKALIIYHRSGQYGSDYYIEVHNMGEKGEIFEGRPLTQDAIQGMVDIFYRDSRDRQAVSGLMPECMLSFSLVPGGKYNLVWYRPATRQVMHFAKDLNIPSGMAGVPPLVFRTDGTNLEVFALATDERPTVDTPLFRAPFHNVGSDGEVCLGSGRIDKPAKTYASIIEYWEKLFWLTEFSHITGENPAKENINILWKGAVQSNTMWHPVDAEVLLPCDTTIKDLL